MNEAPEGMDFTSFVNDKSNAWCSEEKMRKLNELVFGADSQDTLQCSLNSNDGQQLDGADLKRNLRDRKKLEKFKELVIGCDEDVQLINPSSRLTAERQLEKARSRISTITTQQHISQHHSQIQDQFKT